MEYQTCKLATQIDWENDIELYKTYLETNELSPAQQAAIVHLIKAAKDRVLALEANKN